MEGGSEPSDEEQNVAEIGGVEQQDEAEGDTAQERAPKRQRREETRSHSQLDAMFSFLLRRHTGEVATKQSHGNELHDYVTD